MECTATVAASQYLTFRLDQEFFAVEINQVREVLEFTAVTKVPRMPAFMSGIINLRGSVVPVVDMRIKLGLSMTEKSVDTCVVIAEVTLDGERTVLGVLVDAVQEVIDFDASQIVPPPSMGGRIDTAVIHGMGKQGDRFTMILDLDRIFAANDLREAGAETAA